MKADSRFLNQPLTFWAHVRSVSEHVGYTHRRKSPQRTKGEKREKGRKKKSKVKVPTLAEIRKALQDLNLRDDHLCINDKPTKLGQTLLDYFAYRAEVLNSVVEPLLMTAEQAQALYEKVRTKLNSTMPVVMNKQKGEMRKPAYLTCLVNMLLEANKGGVQCDYDPRELTSVTARGVPLRTLARRVDGAFPSVINPVALWEIKEYYYSKTFGSRIADGVYETLLDGMELEEVRKNEMIDIKHYLILDAYKTWWTDGKSYLCRIVDMIHMGYVDECIIGKEVVERIPALVKEWLVLLDAHQKWNKEVGIDAPNLGTPTHDAACPGEHRTEGARFKRAPNKKPTKTEPH